MASKHGIYVPKTCKGLLESDYPLRIVPIELKTSGGKTIMVTGYCVATQDRPDGTTGIIVEGIGQKEAEFIAWTANQVRHTRPQ